MGLILLAAPLASGFFAERFDEYSFTPGPQRTAHDGEGRLFGFFQPMDIVGGQISPTPFALNEADGSLANDFQLEQLLESCSAMVRQPDGKWILAGGLGNEEVVLRVTAEGRLDPTFNWVRLSQGVRFLSMRADGRILVTVSGNQLAWSHPETVVLPHPTLLQLNADGTVDGSFHQVSLGRFGNPGQGTLFCPTLEGPDGKLYIAGSFDAVDDVARMGFARLNSDGTLDTGYAGSGSVAGGVYSNMVRGIGLQSDGKLVVAGDFSINGGQQIGAMRYNTDGTHDTTFAALPIKGESGMGIVDGVRPRFMEILLDDRILLVSDRLLRLQADGQLDGTFTSLPFGTETYYFSIGSDGRLFVPGIPFVDGTPVNGIAAFTAEGQLDLQFDPGGFGLARYPEHGVILDDGTIAVAGNFNEWQGTPVLGLAFFSDASTLLADYPDLADLVPGIGYVNTASIVPGPGNSLYLYASGLTSAYDSVSGLVRIQADGSVDTSFDFSLSGVNLANIAEIYASPDGGLYVSTGGSPQTLVDGAPVDLVKLNQDGSRDQAFQIPQELLAGLSELNGDNPDNFEARLGSLKLAQVLPDGQLLVLYSRVDYQTGILRLNPSGSLDTSFQGPDFGPPASFTSFPSVNHPQFGFIQILTEYVSDSPAMDVHQMPDGKVYISGRFQNVGGVPAANLVRLTNTGAIDTSWSLPEGPSLVANQFGTAYIAELEADASDHLYLAGRFLRFAGDRALGLVRLTPDGDYDPAFVPEHGFVDSTFGNVTASMTLKEDKLYLFGTVSTTYQRFPGSFKVLANLDHNWREDEVFGETSAVSTQFWWSDTLGWYDPSNFPWINQASLGWLEVKFGTLKEGMWMGSTDPATGWIYAHKDFPLKVYIIPTDGSPAGWISL